MIPNFKDVDVVTNEDGTMTAKYKPMEKVCYDSGLSELLSENDPPPLSKHKLDLLMAFIDD